RDLHVECLPNAIPDKIDIDVTPLGNHDYYRVSDLNLPEGVKVLEDLERVVVGVTQMRAEVVEPTVEAAVVATPAEPEVIKKGKPEEEKEKRSFVVFRFAESPACCGAFLLAMNFEFRMMNSESVL